MNSLITRIKNLQKSFNLPQTGVYDLRTLVYIQGILGIKPSATTATIEVFKAIQRKLGFTGSAVDGIFGVNTTSKIEILSGNLMPPMPIGASLNVSKAAVDLIVNSEISSKQAYLSKYKFPCWPGGESGITIGIGYDIGYATWDRFVKDWRAYLSVAQMNLFKPAIGKKGTAAKNLLSPTLKAIQIPWEAATAVFYTVSLPIYAKSTIKVYPDLDKLPQDVQGAILSIVYNRGTSLSGASRVEMLNLKQLIAEKNLKGTAQEIKSMKRLWPHLPGLLIRRDKEAELVLNARYLFDPSLYMYV